MHVRRSLFVRAAYRIGPVDFCKEFTRILFLLIIITRWPKGHLSSSFLSCVFVPNYLPRSYSTRKTNWANARGVVWARARAHSEFTFHK